MPVIEGPLFTARTCQEYMKMFDLRINELEGLRILDCPAGASSFIPIMAEQGLDVRACDIMYGEEADTLGNRCREHLVALTDALKRIRDHFVWRFYSSPEEMLEKRLNACRRFEESYREHPELYVRGDLRDLPFGDDEFDLLLSSHLLFIYDHRLDREFHERAISEMIRVSSEVRIYPIVKENGKLSDYAESILKDRRDEFDAFTVTVDYEFRRRGNMMLVLKKR